MRMSKQPMWPHVQNQFTNSLLPLLKERRKKVNPSQCWAKAWQTTTLGKLQPLSMWQHSINQCTWYIYKCMNMKTMYRLKWNEMTDEISTLQTKMIRDWSVASDCWSLKTSEWNLWTYRSELTQTQTQVHKAILMQIKKKKKKKMTQESVLYWLEVNEVWAGSCLRCLRQPNSSKYPRNAVHNAHDH